MFKKVLILSASAGAGHTKAALALEKAFHSCGTAEEVRHLDVLQLTLPWFRLIYSWGYLFTVSHIPWLFGWLYQMSDRPWKNERARYLLERFHSGALIRYLTSYQPEWLVTTHFLPPHLTSRLKTTGKFQGRLAVVVTDFDVHAYWLCRNYDRYFVALDSTRARLEQLGIDPAKIVVSGIPIDPIFSREKERADLRRKYELHPEWPVILVSAGASAIGPLRELVRRLLALENPAQIVAICGNNQRLQLELDEMARRLPPTHRVRLKVIGYTHDMDEFMATGDLLVGKPGGLTVSEAQAKGMAFAVFNPIPGQEKHNAELLVAAGVAIYCRNLSSVRSQIDDLLGQPAVLHAMKSAAKALGQPDAARFIVRTLEQLP